MHNLLHPNVFFTRAADGCAGGPPGLPGAGDAGRTAPKPPEIPDDHRVGMFRGVLAAEIYRLTGRLPDWACEPG